MIKQHKYWSILVVCLSVFALSSGTKLFAAGAAKQLAKGIALYEANKNEEAMDYFVDVLLNGTQDEITKANKYMNLIHDQIGGIQKPVEVDADFKEGEVKSLNQAADEAVTAAQEQARLAAEQAAAQAAAEEEAARAALEAKQQQALDAVNAQQAALNDRIEAARQEALEQAQAQRQAALDEAAALTDADLAAATTTAAVAATVPQTAAQDLEAVEQQAAQQVAAVRAAELTPSVLEEEKPAETPVELFTQTPVAVAAATTTPATTATPTTTAQPQVQSVYADLTSPEAVQARELYTRQKLDSMTAAAIEKINGTKGVHLYMRDDRPDALDIEPEVIFEKGQFRQDSLPLLNSIYELLALTQGSAYVILPPGSYTDDVTLAGIREAMALNSYLVSRGISQGKLHYNMGLADEEPPARYANLNGLAIVFDYDAKLPTKLEKNMNNETAPLLSMAIVPLCHAIDRSLGEAFAIDFSVLETVTPIDNWVLQIVQHGRDGKYYVVRQLEGFTPVYHQILWNGRKGIIGPELPCGKYTAVLTGTDLKGEKQTVRRRLVVKCAGDMTTDTCSSACGLKKAETVTKSEALNYKAARLWTKPARKMYNGASAGDVNTQAVSTASSHATKKVTTRTIIREDSSDAESAVAPIPAEASLPPAPAAGSGYVMEEVAYPANNPYDMPYEEN